MRTLIDKDTNLKWVTFDRAEVDYIDEYSNYINQINLWSDNKYMQKYITKDPIGNDLSNLFKIIKDTDLYIATDNNEVVATVLIGHTRPLDKQDLLNYINSKAYLDKSISLDIPYENYLDKNDVTNLLKDEDQDNIYIEYLLVNPKYHGKGIATHFYKFMKDNLDFFGGQNIKYMQASIKEGNIPSRKSVLKNGFKRMKPTTEIPLYSIYYLHLRELEETKENI